MPVWPAALSPPCPGDHGLMSNASPIANDDADDATARRPSRRRSPLRAFIWTSVVGTGFGLLAVVVVASRMSGERMPEIDAAAIEAATARWQAAEPASYNMKLHLDGAREQRVEVEVRDRNVTKLLLDGEAPRQRRTWDYWSATGLFDIIEADMARAEESPPGSVRLFAEFDETYGYPRHYRRTESSATRNAEWTVERFEVVED
jgi:hypothetical protein